jgi:hypothetical protein
VLIGGDISGLPSETHLIIEVRPEDSGATYELGGHAPEHWEAELYKPFSRSYVVVPEVEGYASEPVSYTIEIVDGIAYVVHDGARTREEIDDLDFHFTPGDLP